MKIYCKRLLAVYVLALTGCAGIQETPKIVLGTSTHELQARRDKAIVKEFDIGYDELFTQAEKIFKTYGCKIFYKNKVKGVIVVMNFSGFIDTSEAGIFFSRITPAKTKIEITSQSQEVAKTAANILFPRI